MICKDSVLTWFKGLSSHNRIDLMCSLLHKCLPFELRFLGTCLENLGRQDFTQMKDFEVKANNTCELSDFHTQSCIISDTRTRQKLALYVCLLHSLNTACSTIIYKCLYGIDVNQVVAKARNSDEKILEELLTIYTVAVNHPAFTFEQRSNLGYILLRLAKEENRLQSERLAEAVNADYAQAQLEAGDHNLPRTDLPPPPQAPPGMGYPAGSLIHYPLYYPGQQLPNQQVLVQLHVNYPPVPAPLSSEPLPASAPGHGSPLVSRHSSPSPSQQHSRTNSPSRRPKGRPNFSEPPPSVPYSDRCDPPKDTLLHSDSEVRNVSERLMGLTTEEMLRGAAVSLNGIIPQPRGAGGGGHSAAAAVTQRHEEPSLMFNPSLPPGLRTPLMHSRLSQSTMYKDGLHGMEDGRKSTSSSGSDASSTTHSPPSTPAPPLRHWDKGADMDEYATRRGGGRGRGRYGVQTLPRERAPMAAGSRGREGPRSAPPTPHEENKPYVVSGGGPDGGVLGLPPAAGPLPLSGPFLPGPFAAPQLFPQYPPTFVRTPFTYHNGEATGSASNYSQMLYTYHTPTVTAAFPPSALVTYTSSIPPPKTACYNCSSHTHHPNDCKEPTMEEYCTKGQYRIDYGKAELLDK